MSEENFEGFEVPQIEGLSEKNKAIYDALLLADPANINIIWLKALGMFFLFSFVCFDL